MTAFNIIWAGIAAFAAFGLVDLALGVRRVVQRKARERRYR